MEICAIICTKAGHGRLELLLADLAHFLKTFAHSTLKLSLVLVDDTDPPADWVSHLSAYGGVFAHAIVIDRATQMSWAKLVCSKVPAATPAILAVKALGGADLDLGGCKQIGVLAFLAASELRATRQALFLDDDMRLYDSRYNNKRFESSGATALREMMLNVSNKEFAVAGCQYIGRVDTDLRGHLLHSLRATQPGDPSRTHIELAQSGAAIRFSAHISEKQGLPDPFAPAFSGGTLLATRRCLELVAYPRLYNEDWIFLDSVERQGGHIFASQECALHAGSLQLNADAQLAEYQAHGQFVYRLRKQRVHFANDQPLAWHLVRTAFSGESQEMIAEWRAFRTKVNDWPTNRDCHRIDAIVQILIEQYTQIARMDQQEAFERLGVALAALDSETNRWHRACVALKASI